jgi:adhesin/invasin
VVPDDPSYHAVKDARVVLRAAVILSAAECPVDDITTPSDPPTPADPTPTSLVIVSGNNQTATVGQALTNPLIVRVDDQSSNAMSGITVSFAVTQGGGSVGTASVATGSDGQAQTTWMLGTDPGQQQVDATVTDITNPTTFAAMADADVPASVALNDGDGQDALEGTAVPTPPSVLVRDQYNNPVPDVQVTFAVTAGTGTLSGAVAMTDASGIATLGSWTLGA